MRSLCRAPRCVCRAPTIHCRKMTVRLSVRPSVFKKSRFSALISLHVVNDASYTCIYKGRPTERCIWSNMSCLIVLRNSKFGTRAIAAVVSSPIHLTVVKRNLILRECLISTFSGLVTDTGSTRTWTRSAFRRFLQDVIRVWPGPGCPGLSLLQLGMSTSINDITEPYLPIPASPA